MTHDNDLCTSDKNEAKREWRHPYVSIARGWSCCLVFIQCRIMSSFEQQLSLHVLLLSISLHHICVNWVNNDNVHQSIKVVSSNKIIHSLSSMAREKVEDLLLHMCSTFQNNSCNNILKCVVGVNVRSFLQRHWNKWVPKLLMVWPHWHHKRWATIGCGKTRWVRNVIRKWVGDKWNVGVVGQANNQVHALGSAHEQRRVGR